jgi:1-acyl-sn-glycerol-3-phosphate acyltransferase/nucleoside-diphosphate-sugar epimerase
VEPVSIKIIAGKRSAFPTGLITELRAETQQQCSLAGAEDLGRQGCARATHYVYFPSLTDKEAMTADLVEAALVFPDLARTTAKMVVVISSALIYGTGPGRQPWVSEQYAAPGKANGAIAESWNSLEQLALQNLPPPITLTILRPVTVVPSRTFLSRILNRRLAATLAGYDANLQLLSPDDLVQAILRSLSHSAGGIFNVAPDRSVPTRAAIRLEGSTRLPVPLTLFRLNVRKSALDYLRYPWTVSNQKIKNDLGFVPGHTSLSALLQARKGAHRLKATEHSFDEFGMDPKYIGAYGRTLFRFLADFYWRIEERGLEHIPRQGRGILVGMHRGFMPWDGVMALHLVARSTGRYPRFLIHPGLLIFPFLANFMTKLGGVVACQKSADRILEENELLGVFPEGIQGAFTFYRDAYKLQGFARNAFVKMALANRAPIIPFVTVGSAEIFPIFGKIESRRWNRYTEWPYIPLTPTFPILPLPLPSKWHTCFLPPIHVEKMYPPEAAQDRSVVKAISLQVRAEMQQAVDKMLKRRRSIFYGSIFEPEAEP